MRGAYQLKSLKGPSEFYTRQPYYDVFKDTQTGIEYTKGEYKLFEKVNDPTPLPQLVEDMDGRFQMFVIKRGKPITSEELLKEITVNNILK